MKFHIKYTSIGTFSILSIIQGNSTMQIPIKNETENIFIKEYLKQNENETEKFILENL